MLEFWTVNELVQELKTRSKQTDRVRAPGDTFSALFSYRNRKVEHFFVIHVNGNHQIVKKELITKGLINRTLVHPREVFRSAIKQNSAGIILAHNHPSGNIEPSAEDHEISRRIFQAGEIIGITVLDHVIFGSNGYYSYLENNRFPFDGGWET